MADHDSIVSSDKLKAIADAIRDKTKNEHKMTLDEMPQEIESISGGSGETPTCGIVPTEWSSNGFVLSADSYGSVQACALKSSYYGQGGSSDIIDPHIYDPESHQIIVYSYTDAEYLYSSLAYAYINQLTFQSAPEIIGAYAFDSCYWLEIDELPEGITHIGDFAFNHCYNIEVPTIPSTVEYIGEYAFNVAGNKYYTSPNYDETATYAIGDIVNYNNVQYTCIIPVTSPEEFDYSKWQYGVYPGILEEYDPSHTYHTGDIVYNPEQSEYYISTILKYKGADTVEGYYPGTTGYLKARHYNVGDVINTTDDYGNNVYTCYREVTVVDPEYIDSSCWVKGYAPNILGEFDESRLYHIGDCIYDYHDGIMTCIVEGMGHDAEFFNGYYPEILGDYDTEVSYTMGQTVCYSSYSGNCYTCIVNSTIPGEFNISDWVEGYYPNLVGVYSDSQVYNRGDVIYVIDMYSTFTCIYDNTIGEDPRTFAGSWIRGYAPDIVGIFESNIEYSVGDIVGIPGPYGGIRTVVTPTEERTMLLYGYISDLRGEYNPELTYHPGDIIVVPDYAGGNPEYNHDTLICISPTPVSGEFDRSDWHDVSTGSDAADYKIHKLIFLGTPTTVDSYAFDGSVYNVLLVPWAEGEGPDFNSDNILAIIYNYHPEQDNS